MAGRGRLKGAEFRDGSRAGRFLMLLGVVLAAAGAALATYIFVISPLLNEPGVADGDLRADAHGGDEEYVPHRPESIELPTSVVNVMREGEGPSAILQFGVTIECNDAATARIVKAHKARFVDIINKLHDSRTRSELDDTLLMKESIQRQALQKSNELLRKIQGKPDDNVKITAVLHYAFVVQDPG